jgi:hypothetical protein
MKVISTLVLMSSIWAAGCAGPSRVYVRTGPPAPIVTARIVSPGPEFVWIEGYHRWDGARYVWVTGRWERPPRLYAVWESGHWAKTNRGWYFIEGRWRY